MPPAYRGFSAVAKAEAIIESRLVTIGGPLKFSQVQLRATPSSQAADDFEFAYFVNCFPAR
jgi:hypothetical protein